MINAPIPGMSLTGEPKKYPWERPPELVEPEAVADYYIDKLSNKDTMRSVLDFLVLGELTLVETVEGLMRLGVSKGLHTVDTGLIVAPLIHKTVKLVADAVGIEYEEGIVDKKATEETKKMRKEALTKKFLKGMKKDQPAETDDEMVSVEEVMEEPVQGLIPRRNK